MSYVVDLNKSPKTLFTELINTENSITLTEDQFAIHDPVPETVKVGYDTKTTLEWVGGGDTIGLVNVFYNRIDINTLFSLTGINLKEVNLTKLNGHVVLDDNFFLELQRRYGLNCTSADFEFVLDTDGMYVFRAKPTRLAAGFANVFKMMAPGRTSITIPTQDNAASDLMLPSQRYWLFQYN